MTLIESMMEPCVMMDKVSTADGMGGFAYTWVEGAEFSATIIKQSSPEVMAAEMNGANEQFTIVVFGNVTLEYHDVIKRLSDGATFRVLGYTRDTKPPKESTYQYAKVSAERWEIPT